MTRTPDASADHDTRRQHLLALLRDSAVDAAIDAGLMAFACDPAEPRDAPLAAMQVQLREAWDARARYRARAARLERIERERQAGRLTSAAAATAPATASAASPTPPSPALPPAVAAALARAKARAQERSPQ